jgi:hypothetical protein
MDVSSVGRNCSWHEHVKAFSPDAKRCSFHVRLSIQSSRFSDMYFAQQEWFGVAGYCIFESAAASLHWDETWNGVRG